MAIPNATVTAESASAGGIATGLDNILVLGCSSQGPLNTPRFLGGGRAAIETFGYGDSIEFDCKYMRQTRKKVCHIRLPSTVPGAVEFLDVTGVAGSSVVTITGTPHRAIQLVFEVLTAGTIGTEGITFRYSINDGLDYSGTIRLGTANTYAVPKTGITLNFAAGDLDVDDRVYALCSSPKWDDADFADAITAAIALQQKFRAVVVIGDFNKAELDTIKAQVDLFYDASKRSVFFTSARDWYHDAYVKGNPQIAFVNSNPDTITRDAGSFVSDGFKVGMTLTVSGSDSNDGTYTIATVAALTLTLDAGDTLVVEAADTGRTLTGEETETTWASSVDSNFASFVEDEGRIGVGTGMVRMHSEIFQWRMRVPLMWAVVIRWMQHDIQVSPNRKADGTLDDCSLTDDDGNVVEHDARTLDLLSESGFLTARTYVDELGGVFVTEPHTKAPPGSSFRVLPWRAVANLYCDVVQKSTESFIGDNPELNDDGTLTDDERERYKEFVNEQLEAELRSPKLEGPRASKATWDPSDEDVLNTPGAILHGEGQLITLGLIGSVATVVQVNPVVP